MLDKCSLLSAVGELVDSLWFCHKELSDVLNGWLLLGTTGSQEHIGARTEIHESKQFGMEFRASCS
jgi:hypothetical protein